MLTVDLAHFSLKPGQRVLDLGCGEGRHVNAFYMLAPVTSVGVDLAFNDVLTAKQRAAALDEPLLSAPAKVVHLVSDGMSLPFESNSFDKIICSEVLEHIPDYEQVLQEIGRVLKPGGDLCVSVPRYWPEKICWLLSDAYHQVAGGHVRIFKTSQLKSAVQAQGFAFHYRHWAHALHSPFWWLKCLFWKTRDENKLIALYHRVLVWDLMRRPWITRQVERMLNPLCGKSVVLYFTKTRKS